MRNGLELNSGFFEAGQISLRVYRYSNNGMLTIVHPLRPCGAPPQTLGRLSIRRLSNNLQGTIVHLLHRLRHLQNFGVADRPPLCGKWIGPPKFGGLREAVGGCTLVRGIDEEEGTCVTD